MSPENPPLPRLAPFIVEGARTLARLVASRQDAERFCHKHVIPMTPTLEEALRRWLNATAKAARNDPSGY